MPPEPGDKAARFKQVEALFEAAQQQPDDQRRAFLRQACPDDPALRAEVESLLRGDSGSHLIDGSPLSSIAERTPALKPGDKLGNFEIVAMIGRGGMGEVYRARDLRLKRDVAIKTLPPGFAGDRDRIARFEREARAASALNHPNIVSVYDIGTEGGVSFIVSELVDGETLARVIQRGSLPLRKLIEVTTQICDGLAAAHAAGVIHRDLKPGNIMLTRDGRVKILDFGLARQDHAHGVDSTTIEASHPGMIMGTPGYMSPEQVRGEPTDARSDIFSLGVILYEIATGQRAFRGTSSIEVMNSILKDDPPSLPAASPPSLDRIIRRCLEKEPARRFQTATDLGFALQTTALPQPTTVLGKAPKRAWVWWAVLAAAALSAGTVYWLAVRQLRLAAPPEITFRRLTNDAGLTTGAAISPDGKLVAYASDRADPSNLDIWVQQADGGGLARLTDDAADDYDPSFSPDATQIAFRSERKGRGIYVAPALGGEARLVIPEGRGPRFSPDGQKLIYWTGPKESGRVDGSSDIKFWVKPLAGGEAKQIGAGCRLFDRTAVWSPDSSRVLFLGICGRDLSRASQPENYGISAWVDTLDGRGLKQNRELYALWRTIHSTPRIDQWIANPSRLLIPLPVGDATSIAVVRVSADGTRVEGLRQSLTFASGKAASVSAALNGRIVLSAGTSESHIWSLPFGGAGSSTGDLKQLTSGPAGEFFPALSADGKKLSFLSIRANSQRLFYKDLATGHEKEVSTEGYRYDTPLINAGRNEDPMCAIPEPGKLAQLCLRGADFGRPLQKGLGQGNFLLAVGVGTRRGESPLNGRVRVRH